MVQDLNNIPGQQVLRREQATFVDTGCTFSFFFFARIGRRTRKKTRKTPSETLPNTATSISLNFLKFVFLRIIWGALPKKIQRVYLSLGIFLEHEDF